MGESSVQLKSEGLTTCDSVFITDNVITLIKNSDKKASTKIEQPKKRLERLIDLYEKDGIDINTYLARKSQREAELEKIEQQIETKEDALSNVRNSMENAKKFKTKRKELQKKWQIAEDILEKIRNKG